MRFLFRRRTVETERAVDEVCSVNYVTHQPHTPDEKCIVTIVCACGKLHRYRIHGKSKPQDSTS